MEQPITGYHRDEEDHWVAELVCGHFQHVRHNPPWQIRTWVTTAEGRAGMLGARLNCKKCDEGAPRDKAVIATAVILASSCSDGNTRKLVDLCFADHDVAVEDLATLNIGYYSYDGVNTGDDFLPLIGRLLASDTWYLATPLYWYTMSAQAKTFLDRFSDLITTHKELGRLLRGKRLGVICSGVLPQLPPHFDEPFALTCGYLGMQFTGTNYRQYDNDE